MKDKLNIYELDLRLAALERRVEALSEKSESKTSDDGLELPDFEKWREDAIRTEAWSCQPGDEGKEHPLLFSLKLAPEDFYVIKDGKRKDYFTWDEAMEYEEKVLKPNGWRLPTCKEWAQICACYIDERGSDDVERFMRDLKMEMKGCQDEKGEIISVGGEGHFWASTSASTTDAYYLTFSSDYLNPQDDDSKGYGLTVRCVAQ